MFEGEYTKEELVEVIGQEAMRKLLLFTDAVDMQTDGAGRRVFESAIKVEDDGEMYWVKAIYTFSAKEVMEIDELEHLDWDDPEFEVELIY